MVLSEVQFIIDGEAKRTSQIPSFSQFSGTFNISGELSDNIFTSSETNYGYSNPMDDQHSLIAHFNEPLTLEGLAVGFGGFGGAGPEGLEWSPEEVFVDVSDDGLSWTPVYDSVFLRGVTIQGNQRLDLMF